MIGALAKKHVLKVVKKQERIDGLKALLEEWEPFDPDNHEYVLELRAKLRAAQNQLDSMAI
jgi:hypothetical protein